MTVKSSTGPSFLVNYSKFLDEKLKESIDSWSVPINFFIHLVANK